MDWDRGMDYADLQTLPFCPFMVRRFFYIISAIASLLNKGGVIFENENRFFENETER